MKRSHTGTLADRVRDSGSRLLGGASLASAVTDAVCPVALGAEAVGVTGAAGKLWGGGDGVHVVNTHLLGRSVRMMREQCVLDLQRNQLAGR